MSGEVRRSTSEIVFKPFMKIGLITLMAFLVNASFAQTCIHTGLSKNFDFKITKRIINADSNKVTILIQIYYKNDHRLVQSIRYTSYDLYTEDFKHVSHDCSFITGKNKNAGVADGNYGDIVVADFNFDGREDFAVKKFEPADTGPTYYFYLQTDKGFKQDDFLSDSVDYIPAVLNVKRHTLVTAVAVAMGVTLRKYNYDPLKEKWRRVSEMRFDNNENRDKDPDKILKKLKQ